MSYWHRLRHVKKISSKVPKRNVGGNIWLCIGLLFTANRETARHETDSEKELGEHSNNLG